MAIVTKVGTLHEKSGCIEYKMPDKMARELLKNRKGDEAPAPATSCWLSVCIPLSLS